MIKDIIQPEDDYLTLLSKYSKIFNDNIRFLNQLNTITNFNNNVLNIQDNIELQDNFRRMINEPVEEVD